MSATVGSPCDAAFGCEPRSGTALPSFAVSASCCDSGVASRVIAWAWRRGFGFGVLTGVVAVGCLLLLTGCAGSIEADNTPWGRSAVRTEAKPPPPIYTRSSRSTVTKPPPPAPAVEETECESGVCGVAGR